MNAGSRVSPRTFTNPDALNSRHDHLRAVIARLGGYCDWRLDSTGWVVTLHLPQERTFAGPTLEAALAACVTWLTPDTTSGASSRFLDRLPARGAARGSAEA